MTDLTTLDFAASADAGAVLQLMHPTDHVPVVNDISGDELSLNMLGRDSQRFIDAAFDQAAKAQEIMWEIGKLSPPRAKDWEQAHTLALLTQGWKGIPMCWVEPYDGVDPATGQPKPNTDQNPAPFSYDNALKLYLNRGVRWVRIKAQAFVDDRANFLRR